MSEETFSPHNEEPGMIHSAEKENSAHEAHDGQISHEEFAEKLTELNQMQEPMRTERINAIMMWRIDEQEGKPAELERELYYPGWSMRNLESLVRQSTLVRKVQKMETRKKK